MPTTTTTKRPRKAPAAEVATSKADAVARGLRRFRTRRCDHCRHVIKIIRADGSTVCEACFVRAVLGGEDNPTRALRPWSRQLLKAEAERIRKAAERGDPAYRVDKAAAQAAIERPELQREWDKQEAEVDAWRAEMVRLAEQDAPWARELMLVDPEGVREALTWKPWNRAKLDPETIDRIRRVFEYGEAALVPAEWLGCPVETTREIRYYHRNAGEPQRVEVETKASGRFEVAEEVACGREPGPQDLAAAWLAVHGHRWSPTWVSSREVRQLLDLVPVGRTEFMDREDDEFYHYHRTWQMWDLVEPLVRARIDLAHEQRYEALSEPEDPEAAEASDKAHEAEVRRWQRYIRGRKDSRDTLKSTDPERWLLDMEIRDAEESRPQPGPGYQRRKAARERDAFMTALVRRHARRTQQAQQRKVEQTPAPTVKKLSPEEFELAAKKRAEERARIYTRERCQKLSERYAKLKPAGLPPSTMRPRD
jgi:hypothetical protein